MAITSTRSVVLSLYRQMLRESSKFPSYNFRTYFVRRTRDRFRANTDLVGQDQIDQFVNETRSELEVIRRQVVIHRLYPSNPLVVEKKQ